MSTDLELLDLIYGHFDHDHPYLTPEETEEIINNLDIEASLKRKVKNKIKSFFKIKEKYLKVKNEFLELFNFIEENLSEKEELDD